MSFLSRYRVVPRSGSRLSKCNLVPLAAMLPIIIYAYAVQSIVTARTEVHERQVALTDVKSLSQRLDRQIKLDSINCRDYAHWGESFDQIVTKDMGWVETNMEDGLTSFGFDIIVFQAASGEVVYVRGMNETMLRDIERYGVLRRCTKSQATTGTVTLDGRVFSIAADGILRSDKTGPSRGMLLIGRAITPAYLASVSPGTQHRLSLCQGNGQIVAAGNLGELNKMPKLLVDIIGGGKCGSRARVANSVDNMTSYGILPVRDLLGEEAGALVDARSRASVVATLRTIRHMSISLMALCLVIGIAGVSYFKNKAMALRANRDELTGLYNHGYLQEYLKNQTQLAQRHHRPLAVMMIDIDHFKYINDSHGHATGDAVLKALATMVVGAMRGTDVTARYGGEEFVVVLPETDLVQAQIGADRLLSMIRKHVVKTRGSGPATDLSFTVSIGVAAHPEDGDTSTDLLRAADTALAEAKRTRNTVCAYQDTLKNAPARGSRLATLDAFLRDSSISTIRPLVAAIDTRDPGSVSHSEKAAEFAVAMGRELGFSTQDLALTCKATLLHDVGMIGVPDALLTKMGQLSDDEMMAIRAHAKLGADILTQSPQLSQVAEIVLRHHERYDGAGYPDGLAGEGIPIISRVVAVADALDAMVLPRSYRKALTLDEAIKELRKEAGKQFDPKVIEVAGVVVDRLLSEVKSQKAA